MSFRTVWIRALALLSGLSAVAGGCVLRAPVVFLALVLGGSAAVGINSLRHQAPPTPKPETATVLVAAVDIPPFAAITTDMVKTQDWPKEVVPADALTKLEDVLDRPVLTPLVKGELLFENKLAPRGAGRGMATKIPKGRRAFTIHTPTVEAGVAGFILPGNKVDVLLTLDGQDTSTVTLLQNVEILAIEQRVVAPAMLLVDPNQLKSVTLLVTPPKVARLTLGQSKGRLCLSLRNHGERIEPAKPPEPHDCPYPLEFRTSSSSNSSPPPARIRTPQPRERKDQRYLAPDLYPDKPERFQWGPCSPSARERIRICWPS